MNVGGNLVWCRLGPGCLCIGVVRSSQHGHEYVSLPALTTLPVHHRYGLAAVVYKHLLPDLMLLTHRKALNHEPIGDKAHKTGYTKLPLDISTCTLPREEKVSSLYAVAPGEPQPSSVVAALR